MSAKLERVPPAGDLADEQLRELFDQNDARQVLHVTFGKVLTIKDAAGRPLFRDRLLASLKRNEETYNDYLQRHFRRHVEPFVQ